MSTIADTALRSAFGLVVVAAMLVTIWLARESGTRAAAVGLASESHPSMLHPEGNDPTPATRTAIPQGQRAPRQASPLD